MNFLKTGLITGLLTSLILISGCSDLFQKDVIDKSLESNKFKANCELNVDEFSFILEENIEEAIDCLGKNLKLFITAVESKRPGYLSRTALINYIKRNRKDIKPEVLRALKSVFDINFLVYGEDRDFISATNIDALVKAAKTFNEQAATNFKPIFMSDSTISYNNYLRIRDQGIKPAALIISSALKEIFRPDRKGRIDQLNLVEIIDAFTNENNEASMAKVKKMLFAKKIILGGDKEELTHIELGRLIDNFSSYVILALDGVRYRDIRLDQKDMIQFLNSDVELLNSLVFSASLGDRSKEHLFTVQDAIDAAKVFISNTDSDLDLDKYYDLLKEAKQIVMDGESDKVTGGDLRRLFNHGLNLLKTGSFFHRFWKTEELLLETSRRPITYDFKNLYDLFKSEKPRVDDFVRILKKYRFMRGENISAFYTDDFKRNPNAVFEVAIYEYAMTLVMKKFGCPNNNLGGKVSCDAIATLNGVYMKKDHVINVIQKFRKVLIETDMILPGREVNTAETITLLGSLFQYQSDENKVFDVNEASEFAISLFTAIDVSKDLNVHFLKCEKDNSGRVSLDCLTGRTLDLAREKCEIHSGRVSLTCLKEHSLDLDPEKMCGLDEYGRVSPDCFKKQFFEGVCYNYPDQFPKLFASLGATVYENNKLVCRIPLDAPNLAYLDRAVKAARTCNVYPNSTEEIYYSKGDMMSVFLAMMHIETTIIRWDTRIFNNAMDSAEVMDAYNIYSPALDGFLEDKPGYIKKLKKQIYQYMVKYEQIPDEKDFGSIWKFLKFLVSFDKGATANRKTIASLLVTIGEQGTPSYFDCSLLRDPDNIPEDYDPTANGEPIANPVVVTPLALTQSDKDLFEEIQGQSDTWIRWLLNINWPEIFNF